MGCPNQSWEEYEFERLTTRGSVSKSPSNAPNHRKSAADITAGLEANAQAAALAATEAQKVCPAGCKQLGDIEVSEDTFWEEITYTWTEPYVQDGTTKTATYVASRQAEYKKVDKTRKCRASMRVPVEFLLLGALKVSLPADAFLTAFPDRLGDLLRKLEPSEEELLTEDPLRLAAERIKLVDFSDLL